MYEQYTIHHTGVQGFIDCKINKERTRIDKGLTK